MKIILDPKVQSLPEINQICLMSTLAGYSVVKSHDPKSTCLELQEGNKRFIAVALADQSSEYLETIERCYRLDRVLYLYRNEISQKLYPALASGQVMTLLALDSHFSQRFLAALSRNFNNRFRPIRADNLGTSCFSHAKILNEEALNSFRLGLKQELARQTFLLPESSSSTFVRRANWLLDEVLINAQKISGTDPFDASWLWNGEQLSIEVVDYVGSLATTSVFHGIFGGQKNTDSLGLGWKTVWDYSTDLTVVVSRDKFTAVQASIPIYFTKEEHAQRAKSIEVYQL